MKICLIILLLICLPLILALNETNETISYDNQTVESIPEIGPCPLVYDFIINHYRDKLIYTDDEFELLRMQTVLLKEELENYLMYYGGLCDEELPFLGYNNKLPESEEIEESSDQTLREGFNNFIETFKGDLKYIAIVLGIIIILVYLIDRTG